MSEQPPQLPSQETPDFEKDLSPEEVEKIMEKVQDINAPGTAFTTIASQRPGKSEQQSRLKNIIEHGLLGLKTTSTWPEKTYPEYVTQDGLVDKGKWTEAIRSQPKGEKEAPIFFNVMVRSVIRGYQPLQLMRDSDYVHHEGTVTLIFDLSKFREVTPYTYRDGGAGPGGWRSETMPQEPYTYFVHQNDDNLLRVTTNLEKQGLAGEKLRAALEPGSEALKKLYESSSGFYGEPENKGYLDIEGENGSHYSAGLCLNEKGEVLPSDEWGFILPFRITPRFFQGLVINKQDKAPFAEVLKTFAVPIYDSSGNLLWPKQMSHQEVAELVTKRKSVEPPVQNT